MVLKYRVYHLPAGIILVLLSALLLTACAARHPKPKSPGKESLIRQRTLHADSLGTDSARYVLSPEKLRHADSLRQESDSLRATRDSLGRILPKDSLSDMTEADSLTLRQEEENELTDIVTYSAEDSIVTLGRSQAYLFGKSNITYGNSSLSANFIRLDADSSQVYTQYILDSLGHASALPVFKDGDQSFTVRSMTYNFKTMRGISSGMYTQQGEGYVTALQAKKMPDNVLFMEGGHYTTCNHRDHPHFYINLTRAKVRPEKNIVTGPAYLVVADVPLYFIGLPFGYFPFTQKFSSGIIMPSYGEEFERGLYLRNGGYYFAFNDYFDLALTGEIYSKGSWGVAARSTYRKRYKFNGSIDAGYLSTVHGFKFEPDYSKSKDFHINWTHTQDPKANPLQTFSAGVNFSTSSYDHNAVSSIYSDRYAQNTKSSSISYSRRFPGTPFSISGSFDITQRTADSTIAVTLPNLNIAMSTIYPFKRKKRVGGERWYEKIQVGYSGQLRNSIETKENKLFQSNLLRDWKNGMMHTIPVSATFTLFDYVQLTPSVSYRERWYTTKTEFQYNSETHQKDPADTTYGFYRVWDFSTALSFSTTVYGFFKPWQWLFGKKIQTIRHRLTPSVSLSWAPDFGAPSFGYYRYLDYFDANGQFRHDPYTPYASAMFGVPGRGKQGIIDFSFTNNIEAKILSSADSTGVRKQSIIDNFQWGISYNTAADSLKWSDINASLTLRPWESFSLNLRGTFETYLYGATVDPQGGVSPYKSDRLRILNGRGFGRLRGTGTSFSYTFNNDTFRKIIGIFASKKKDSPEEEKDKSADNTPQSSKSDREEPRANTSEERQPADGEGERLEYDEAGYLKNTFPWSLTFNYSMNLGYDKFNVRKMEYNYKLTHNLSFNGNIKPSPNWSFSFNGNYNFEIKRITDLRLSLTRDMHCWQVTASVIPMGFIKSYNLTISVKSSLLKDLKWDQSSSPRRGNSDWD